jgi:ketosteroid isomerase-like protein
MVRPVPPAVHACLVPIYLPSDVVRAMVAMFNTGDVVDVEAVVAPEYFDYQELLSGPISGPAGFARVVEAARQGFVELEVTIEDLIVGVDRAAARLRWLGLRRSGESVDRQTIDIVRVENGKAVEHWGARS